MSTITGLRTAAVRPDTRAEERLKRRVLVTTIVAAGLVFLDSNVANVALPSIQRSLGVSTAVLQWVVSAYMLTLSVLLLVGGRLADLLGRKRMFTFGLWLYAALAFVAALAPNGAVLVAARGLQGAAGALLVPTTLALINATFEPNERGQAIGTWAAWSGITAILGPLVGGVAIDNFSWRFAFLITPLIAIVALALSRGVPDSCDHRAERRIDWLGILLTVLSLGGIVFALIQGPIGAWTDRWVVASGVVGVVALPALVWWESRTPSPIVPFGMFKNRNLAVANVVTFFLYAGIYGMFFYVPIYSQAALGASATSAGIALMPITLMLFILSPFAGRLNDRYGPRWLMFGGPVTASVGLVVAGFARQGQLWTVLVPGLLLFGLGLGFTVAPVTATAIGSAEERYSGSASGFNNAVARLAGLLAIALMGVVVLQLWQGELAQARQRATAPVSEALASVADRAFVLADGKGLAVEEARRARELTSQAAADSFRNGMLLAAALVATGGIVSAVFIRHDAGVDSGQSNEE